MKRRVELALAFSVLACAAACSKDTPETTPVEVETSVGEVVLPVEAYLPRNTWGRIDVDLTLVRSSPYYTNLRELLGAAPVEQDAQREVFSEILERVDGVTFALGTIRASGDLTGIVVRGSFTLDDVRRWLAALDVSDAVPTDIELDGRPGLTQRDATIVQMDPTTWLLGPTEVMREAFVSPAVPSAFSDPTYLEAKARSSLGAVALRGTILGTPESQRFISRESPLSLEESAHVRAIAFAVAIDQGLRAEGFALLDDPNLAREVVARATLERDTLAQQAPVQMFGLGPVVSGIELVQADADAVVRVNLPDDLVRRLFGMAGGLLQLAGGGQ